ncbi:AP2/ERF and B3 domain-containing protein [Populus alba x Populus x berolinensis]|nr:AP2/ERF and B3 domain-containing protein [Populus alba x Populus x berolinensis]
MPGSPIPIKMQKKLFKKTLSKTDVVYRMTIPMDSLSAFQIPDGKNSKEVVAVDIAGHQWSFRCCTRKKDPHPKPVLSSGWIKFVKNRGLKEGDEVIFSVSHNDGAEGTLQFGIEARKKIKLLGQDVWSNL